MANARERLESLGGMELLMGMMAFDATARPTMLQALGSPLFAPMRESNGGNDDVSAGERRPRRGQPVAARCTTTDRCSYEFMKYMTSS